MVSRVTSIAKKPATPEIRHSVIGPGGSGIGALRGYELFSGVQVATVDVHSSACDFRSSRNHDEGEFIICYCQRGSLEYKCDDGLTRNIASGETFIIRIGAIGQAHCRVPHGTFHGIGVLVSPALLSSPARKIADLSFELDLELFFEMLSGMGDFFGVPCDPALSHIFAELYEMLPPKDMGHMRLKTIELALLVVRILQGNRRVRLSGEESTNRRASVAYQAQEIMMRDITRQATITELARECHTSPTVLKESFKQVFGVPVYTWYRTFRIHRACELLKDRRDDSIAAIAAEVGYANPSKFAKAFSDCMGTTPYIWRENLNRTNEK